MSHIEVINMSDKVKTSSPRGIIPFCFRYLSSPEIDHPPSTSIVGMVNLVYGYSDYVGIKTGRGEK